MDILLEFTDGNFRASHRDLITALLGLLRTRSEDIVALYSLYEHSSGAEKIENSGINFLIYVGCLSEARQNLFPENTSVSVNSARMEQAMIHDSCSSPCTLPTDAVNAAAPREGWKQSVDIPPGSP